jgi:hypothetical protein
MQQCRIYLPCYTWNPQYEAALVETKPQKTIMYNDIYQYQFNVASNNNFNQIIISSQRTPLYLVVIPYPAASNYSNLSFEAYQSVFESAPGTTGPLAYISQFNVLLGSKPVFTMNKDYDFENFQDEICKINSINGANSTGLSSGLISFDDFTYAYRYYVCDLSRRMDINDPTSPSIAIIGKNSSGYDMRLVCFVVYGKQATINMLDGSIV